MSFYPGSEPYLECYNNRMHIQLERWDMTRTFAAITEWASRSDIYKDFIIFHINNTRDVFEWNWIEHTEDDPAWAAIHVN